MSTIPGVAKAPREAPGQTASRVERGDWQTPIALAREVLAMMRASEPACVLEPTCGEGAFLQAAAESFPRAELRGVELAPRYAKAARARCPRATIEVADFFAVDWRAKLASLPEPLLIVGNPPWVTSAGMTRANGANMPARTAREGRSGLDAITGHGNFDISEWMIDTLLAASSNKRFHLAMLCKAQVARKIMIACAARGQHVRGSLRRIDARKHFGAAVEAVLLEIESARRGGAHWPSFASLAARSPERKLAVIGGAIVNDLAEFRATESLSPDTNDASRFAWRSGVKHDAASVMELDVDTCRALALEEAYLFPLLKGSDLARGSDLDVAHVPRKRLIVTQRKLGEDTGPIRERAPHVWAHLAANSERLAARKSRIYRGQPPFAMFGIGGYTFAEHKVAISALHKRLAFRAVEPCDGRPIVLDDTCYFLACASRREARSVARALNGPVAQRFFQARVFWDAKRPINKQLLSALSIERLLAAAG